MDYSESTDMEVAHVLASGFINSSTAQASRTGSGTKSQPSLVGQPVHSKYSAGPPMRPSTAMTNLIRGNKSAETPITRSRDIHHLAAQGEIAAIQAELQSHSVDKIDECGLTSLMWAAYYNQLDMLKFLVKNNASCGKRGENGETALILASSVGNEDIVQYLGSENQSNINEIDDNGNNALMHACFGGHVKCVGLLLKYGSDIQQTNSENLSAFDIAIKAKRYSVQKLLESHLLNLL